VSDLSINTTAMLAQLCTRRGVLRSGAVTAESDPGMFGMVTALVVQA